MCWITSILHENITLIFETFVYTARVHDMTSLQSYITCATSARFIGFNMVVVGISNVVSCVCVGIASRCLPREAVVGMGAILQVRCPEYHSIILLINACYCFILNSFLGGSTNFSSRMDSWAQLDDFLFRGGGRVGVVWCDLADSNKL